MLVTRRDDEIDTRREMLVVRGSVSTGAWSEAVPRELTQKVQLSEWGQRRGDSGECERYGRRESDSVSAPEHAPRHEPRDHHRQGECCGDHHRGHSARVSRRKMRRDREKAPDEQETQC
jgi:hypothetical protein